MAFGNLPIPSRRIEAGSRFSVPRSGCTHFVTPRPLRDRENNRARCGTGLSALGDV